MDFIWKESDERFINNEILYIEFKGYRYMILGRATYEYELKKIKDGEDGKEGEYEYIKKFKYLGLYIYDASDLKNPKVLGGLQDS